MLKVIRRGRPGSSLEPPIPLAGMSILPKGHLSLPSLRWWDGDKAPTHHKTPLLSLQLSSHSFLDSYIEDGLSATAIYTIKTTDAFTTALRYNGEGKFIKIAMIRWPGGVSTKKAREDNNNTLLIKMGGHRWSKGHAFLRPGSHSDSSRKFAIPDYSHAMKWKRYGTSYWCTTSGVAGPIATLDLSKGLEPITLAVYETLRDKDDPQALTGYKGVSFLLLDYLIVTALLCATDVTAWKLLEKVGDMKNIPGSHAPDPGDQELRYVPEFLDHPYATRSRELHSTSSKISLNSLATTVSPSVTTFPRSLESYSIGMSPYLASDALSSRRRSGSFGSTTEIWSEDYWPLLHGTKPNSSAESMEYSGAPSSHASVKSSIHGSPNIPPVPPLPLKFATPLNGPRRSASSGSHREVSRLLDHPHTTAIHSQLSSQPPVPEKGQNSFSSEQPQNVSISKNFSRSDSQLRPLPIPPTKSGIRRIQNSTQSSRQSRSGQVRSLPTTPLLDASEMDSSKASVAKGNGHLQVNALAPPTMKASQGDLAKLVNALTDPQRVLPPSPTETVVFSMPPPSYASIYFAQRDAQNYTPTPTAPPT